MQLHGPTDNEPDAYANCSLQSLKRQDKREVTAGRGPSVALHCTASPPAVSTDTTDTDTTLLARMPCPLTPLTLTLHC